MVLNPILTDCNKASSHSKKYRSAGKTLFDKRYTNTFYTKIVDNTEGNNTPHRPTKQCVNRIVYWLYSVIIFVPNLIGESQTRSNRNTQCLLKSIRDCKLPIQIQRKIDTTIRSFFVIQRTIVLPNLFRHRVRYEQNSKWKIYM